MHGNRTSLTMELNIEKLPGKKGTWDNEIAGRSDSKTAGFVMVIGTLKRGPRHGALQSVPYTSW